MAAEALVIKVSAAGVRTVQRDLNLIGMSGAAVKKSAANMNTALTVYRGDSVSNLAIAGRRQQSRFPATRICLRDHSPE